MAITSKEINLSQLDAELGNQGLIANTNDSKKKLILPADNSTITESELEAAIEAHVAMPERQLTLAEKLESIGLDIEELKAALQ
jgi:hypothetical protein